MLDMASKRRIGIFGPSAVLYLVDYLLYEGDPIQGFPMENNLREGVVTAAKNKGQQQQQYILAAEVRALSFEIN